MSLNLILEKRFWNQGLKAVVGVDEVGRGSLAGPVVAAAVCFNPTHIPIPGIYDSKRVSAKRRIELNSLIRQQARQYAITVISTAKINTQGIAAATKKAITMSLLDLSPIDIALIDGTWAPQLKFHCKAIVHGDAKCYSIAAASILAKVYRDTLMKRLSRMYPHYHWDKNMGYGTSLHRIMIRKLGPSKHHRTLFIRKTLVAANASNN